MLDVWGALYLLTGRLAISSKNFRGAGISGHCFRSHNLFQFINILKIPLVNSSIEAMGQHLLWYTKYICHDRTMEAGINNISF